MYKLTTLYLKSSYDEHSKLPYVGKYASITNGTMFLVRGFRVYGGKWRWWNGSDGEVKSSDGRVKNGLLKRKQKAKREGISAERE